MENIYIFKNESLVPAKVKNIFGTHGPLTLEGKRLDCLTKVIIVADSSTTTTNHIGESISKAKTGSMLGRALVGGVLLGGTAAAVGAITGKKDSQTNTRVYETLKTRLTVELLFNDDTSQFVFLKGINTLHWLLSYANQTPLTDDELKVEEGKAKKEAKKEQRQIYYKRKHDEKEKKEKKEQERFILKCVLWASIIIVIIISPPLALLLAPFGIFGICIHISSVYGVRIFAFIFLVVLYYFWLII